MAIDVCVYCGTNSGDTPAFLDGARQLGAALAVADIGLVYGGGKLGLMGAVADAALEAGGRVTGVIPQSLVDAELAHTGVTRLEVVDSMHARKSRMAELSHGFVAMAGGFGTFEELLEVLTWNQLGFIRKPVVLFDVEDYYAPLLEMFASAVQRGFMRAEHAALAQRATTPADVVALVAGPAPDTPHKWIDRDRSALEAAP